MLLIERVRDRQAMTHLADDHENPLAGIRLVRFCERGHQALKAAPNGTPWSRWGPRKRVLVTAEGLLFGKILSARAGAET